MLQEQVLFEQLEKSRLQVHVILQDHTTLLYAAL